MKDKLVLLCNNLKTCSIRRILTNLFLIFTGAFVVALSLNMLIIPHHLLTGGITGIAIILKYLIKTPVAWMILFLNIPIFVWGYREINKTFFIYSLIGTFALSIMISITRNLFPVPQIDLILVAIFGGALNGAGFGLIFRGNGSTGGTDIIAIVLRKKKNLGLGEVTFYFNLIVILVSLIFFPVNVGLYTIISMYVASNIMDTVIIGVNTKKSVIIISDRPTQIGNCIINELHRGVTYFVAQGAYSKMNKTVVNSVINRFELAHLKDIVTRVDPGAFVYISDASEVLGQGFTTPVKKQSS
ncbi:protein of unknown function DUF161 [Desulfofarcimen acetoxidans DSM 771]|uniref:DUF2179 domain-containing protein n=1 Tax=Desulfofarcimen acetoxidans (strain ATCC 49208 / DSM 771 / KCTC 5769 / VKM B-1644 / 5575) TaxID=485916 RepID=C8W5C1_DESAS|nr:YitT family protein [Desulfofarcimen acetoxidans]ACV62103.1 protein of unknown function DUF161 [Desulfofarcimen acetoxidans DSM 771]